MGCKKNQLEKLRNAGGSGNKKELDSSPVVIPVLRGCHVPEPVHCTHGSKVNPGESGVRMLCSNEKCPFDKQLVHEDCIEVFEEHLVKILATLGSARGWTHSQRMSNLWEKKGQGLIAKHCRCRCEMGVMRLDVESTDRAARLRLEMLRGVPVALQQPIAPEQAAAKKLKKKANAKVLPTLNFGKSKTAAKGALLEEKENQPPRLSWRSSGRDRIRSRRDSSPGSIGSSTFNSTPYEFRLDNNYVDTLFSSPNDDEDSDETESIDTHVDLVPAPKPPPQMKSYASAIKRTDTPIHNEDEFNDMLLKSASYDDSGVEIPNTGSSTSLTEKYGEKSKPFPILTPPHSRCGIRSSSQEERHRQLSGMDIDMFHGSVHMSPPSSPESHSTILKMPEGVDDIDMAYLNNWTPFSFGFQFGEALLGSYYLPPCREI